MPLITTPQRFSRALTLVAIVLAAGCADSTRPRDVPEVALTVTLSSPTGNPSAPISFGATARNVGTMQLWRCQGCGCGNGLGVYVLGPDGKNVVLHDNPFPLDCPDGQVAFERDASVQSSDAFTGVLYDLNGSVYPAPTYEAPPGTYTVVARFSYATQQWGEPVVVERRSTFTWAP